MMSLSLLEDKGEGHFSSKVFAVSVKWAQEAQANPPGLHEILRTNEIPQLSVVKTKKTSVCKTFLQPRPSQLTVYLYFVSNPILVKKTAAL